MTVRTTAPPVIMTILATAVFLCPGCGPKIDAPPVERGTYSFTLSDDGLFIAGLGIFPERDHPERSDSPLTGTWSQGRWTMDYPSSTGSGVDLTFELDGGLVLTRWRKKLASFGRDENGRAVNLEYKTTSTEEIRGRWRWTDRSTGEIVLE